MQCNIAKYKKQTTRVKRTAGICFLAVMIGIGLVMSVGGISHADSINTTDFVTTWKTDNAGDSNSQSITIPTTGTGYDYSVDWNNDGIYDETGINGDVTHDFGAPGMYTIRIAGNFPRIHFNNAGDKRKLLEIKQWGTISWDSFENAFAGAEHLAVNAVDAPNLSGVTSFRAAFVGCFNLSGNFANWDTSTITDMSGTFFAANFFNADLSSWDTSNVENMSQMFGGAKNFTSNISGWNTANVTNMSQMFSGATKFNRDLSEWDTSNVLNMGNMFNIASSFNQSLAAWDMSQVADASNMLSYSGISRANYDATLIGWAGQALQPNVNFSALPAIYCQAEVARQSIIDDYGWVITDNKFCGEPAVTGVNFDLDGNNPIMTITGHGFNKGNSSTWSDGLNRSLVSLNNVALPFCAEGTGMTAGQWIATYGNFYTIAGRVSDMPSCYQLVNSVYTPLFTDTQVIVVLPSGYNTTDQGSVSVNGSTAYVFNESEDSEEPAEASVQVDGVGPLNGKPAIPAKPTFKGMAPVGSQVTVTVHSDPVTCTVTASLTGTWSCTLSTALPAGEHTVNVRVVTPANDIIELGPYTVVVRSNGMLAETGTSRSGLLFMGVAFVLAGLLCAGYTYLRKNRVHAR